MTTTTNTSAPASAAGFCYQFVRALHRIFRSTHPHTRFGIETADDVEEIIHLSTGTLQINEQDKLTTLDKNPLQDSSRNLWNTLRNWLRGLDQARQDYAHLQYILVTNKPIPAHSLAAALGAADSSASIAEAIQRVRTQAGSMAGETAAMALEVASFNDTDLAFLIANMQVIDAVEVPELKNNIMAEIHAKWLRIGKRG